MDLTRVAGRTAELATAIGPIETLVAIARLEDALAELDRMLCDDLTAMGWASNTGDTGLAIDLRDLRSMLEVVKPVLSQADVRINDLAAALEGR